MISGFDISLLVETLILGGRNKVQRRRQGFLLWRTLSFLSNFQSFLSSSVSHFPCKLHRCELFLSANLHSKFLNILTYLSAPTLHLFLSRKQEDFLDVMPDYWFIFLSLTVHISIGNYDILTSWLFHQLASHIERTPVGDLAQRGFIFQKGQRWTEMAFVDSESEGNLLVLGWFDHRANFFLNKILYISYF